MHIHDIRNQLPTRDWVIGWQPTKRWIVWHFNGPPVRSDRQAGEGLIAQLHTDCDWQMRPRWAGTPHGADGLQYHYVVGQDGQVYQTRHAHASLWHCGHTTINPMGLSVHMPIGYNESTGEYQVPSDAMIQSLIELTELLRAENIPKDHVLGHVELGTTGYCPGGPLMDHLRDYRNGTRKKAVKPFVEHPPLTALQTYRIKPGQRSTVRQGPARSYPIVREIKGRSPNAPCPDRLIWVDAIKHDEQQTTIDGGKRWMHMAYIPDQQADEGFIHETGLELVADREVPETNDHGIPAASPIIGGPFVPDHALHDWIDKHRSHIPRHRRQALIRAYNYCSGLFGISNWLAFHQADKETGAFTSERFTAYNNVAGIGATNDGARGEMFQTLEEAVFIQFLHLYHYAVRDDPAHFYLAIADANPRLQALLKSHGRGSATRWVDLSQKWAVVDPGQPVPGPLEPDAYGMNIIVRAREAKSSLTV